MGITWRGGVTTLIVFLIGAASYFFGTGRHSGLFANVRHIVIFLSAIGALVWFVDLLPTMSRAHLIWSGILAACGMVLFLDAFFLCYYRS